MHKTRKKKPRDPFSSNAVRLSNKEIVFTFLFIIIAILFVAPIIWFKLEKVDTDGQFRISRKYRSDYWLYQHCAEKMAEEYPVIFLGDSVVWGMYVDNSNTIPAKLNKVLGDRIVANLAIDGLHSIATKGLLENYAKSIENKKVILHYNPLWMQSKITDLSYVPESITKREIEDEEEDDDEDDDEDRDQRAPQINHPHLIPQLSSEITSYNKKFSERIGILRERHIPFFALKNHIISIFFNHTDFNQWIIDNPHKNPLGKISFNIDACERDKNMNYTYDWSVNGISKQDWQWLKLEESLQWKAFQGVVKLLKARNNKVCIMVGPLNPYMLTPESLKRFRGLQNDICRWIKSEDIEYVLVNDLPSELYADASHPLAKGYDLITEQLLKTEMLDSFITSE